MIAVFQVSDLDQDSDNKEIWILLKGIKVVQSTRIGYSGVRKKGIQDEF